VVGPFRRGRNHNNSVNSIVEHFHLFFIFLKDQLAQIPVFFLVKKVLENDLDSFWVLLLFYKKKPSCKIRSLHDMWISKIAKVSTMEKMELRALISKCKVNTLILKYLVKKSICNIFNWTWVINIQMQMLLIF
jgi:hypothetical protein